MPYKFKCKAKYYNKKLEYSEPCGEFIYTEFLNEKRTVYRCQKCDWVQAMDGKETKEFFNIEEIDKYEYDLFRKTTKKKIEMKNDIDKDIKEYPALKFLSLVANFIAWFGVITSIIGGLTYLNSDVVKYENHF